MLAARLRPLSTIDVAILVVTVCLSGLVCYWANGPLQDYFRWPPGSGSRTAFQRLQFEGPFFLAPFTLGTAVIIARDGGSRTRRGMATPGVVAVAVATIVGGCALLHAWLLVGAPIPGFSARVFFLFNALEFRISGAVLGAWVSIGLAGKWRPARDSRDRLGRLVGWCWLFFGGMLIVQPLLFG